jgi:precorrin isomerase
MEIEPDNTPDAGRKVKLLSLGDLDGRTNAAKSARRLIEAIENDLGGADRLSAGERVLAHRAAVATAMAEHMEALWLSGNPVDTT